MAGQLQGFPYWELAFDEDGHVADPAAADAFVAEAGAPNGPSDLFVFSHGWNNDRAAAVTLYTAFFGQMRQLLDHPPGGARPGQARVAAAGVFWPSILWPDETPAAPSAAGSGGAASLGIHRPQPAPAQAAAAVPVAALKSVFSGPGEPALVDSLTGMIAARERSDEALLRFRDQLRTLMTGGAAKPVDSDSPELAVGAPDGVAAWKQQLHALGDKEQLPRAADAGGAAGLLDVFDQLWSGAKGALRVASYWRMKERAGVVGQTGLGPLIGQLAAQRPQLRVHLIGHSFGARVVSFALAGLPDGPSPVKSLLLLQGAFSHFTFADQLPFDTSRGGELRGMASRVDGPLLATFTAFDTAVGRAYPIAAELARQDASAVANQASRWGAMGNDGAQAVNAASSLLGPAGTAYKLQAGSWLNLDANAIIKTGGPPSGAHSDIFHPETAWAALSAARIFTS